MSQSEDMRFDPDNLTPEQQAQLQQLMQQEQLKKQHQMQGVLNQIAKKSLEENKNELDKLKASISIENPIIDSYLQRADDPISNTIKSGQKTLEEVLASEHDEQFLQNNPYLFESIQQMQLIEQVKEMQEKVNSATDYQAKDTDYTKKRVEAQLKQQIETRKQQIAQQVEIKKKLEIQEELLNLKDSKKLQELQKKLIKEIQEEVESETKKIEKQMDKVDIKPDDLFFQTLRTNYDNIMSRERDDSLIASGNYLKDKTLKDLYKTAMVKTVAQINRETPQSEQEIRKIKYENIVKTIFGHDESKRDFSELEAIVNNIFIQDNGLELDYLGEINYGAKSTILDMRQRIVLTELIDGIEYKLEDINQFGDEKTILLANQTHAIEDKRKQAIVLDSIYKSFIKELDPEKAEEIEIKNRLSRLEYTGKSFEELLAEFKKDKKAFITKYEADESTALENALNIDDKYSIIDNVVHDVKTKKHYRHTHISDLPNKNIKTDDIEWTDNENILKIIQVSDIHLFTHYFLTKSQLEDIRKNGTSKKFSELANTSKIRDWILSDLSGLVDSYSKQGIEVDMVSYNGDFIEAGLKQKVLMEFLNYEIAKRGGDHTNKIFTSESVEFETTVQNYFAIEQKMQQFFMREFGFSKFDLEETGSMLEKLASGQVASEYENNYLQNLKKIVQDYELQDQEKPKRSLFVREEMMKGNTDGLFGKFEIDFKKLKLLRKKLGGFLDEYESIMEHMSRDIAKQIDGVAKKMFEKKGIMSLYQLGNHDDSFMSDHLQHGINLATEPVYVHHKNGRKIKIRGSVNCDGYTTVGQRAGNHLAYKGRNYEIMGQIKKHHPELLEALDKAENEQEKRAVFNQIHDWIGYHGYDLEFHRLKGSYSSKDKDTVDIEVHHNPVNLGHTGTGKQYGLDLDDKTSSYATLAAVEQLINHSTRDNKTDKIILAGHTHGSQARVDTINGCNMTHYVTTSENPMLIGVDMRNGKTKHYNIGTEDELYNQLNAFKEERLDRFVDNSQIGLDKVDLNAYQLAGFNSRKDYENHLRNKVKSQEVQFDDLYKSKDRNSALKFQTDKSNILSDFEKRNEEQIETYAKFNDKERKIKLERTEKYYN